MARKLVATATQEKRTNSSGRVASDTVRRRKTHTQVFNEGVDDGIRSCIDAMLGQGETRDYIAWTFICQDIPFPFSNDPRQGEWAFEDWDCWIDVEQSQKCRR